MELCTTHRRTPVNVLRKEALSPLRLCTNPVSAPAPVSAKTLTGAGGVEEGAGLVVRQTVRHLVTVGHY